MRSGQLIAASLGGGILVGALVVMALISPAATKNKITLTYVGGLVCVDTDPANPAVKDNGAFRRKAKWKVTKEQQHEYYWEIEYQASSANDPNKAGTGDHLGPVDPIDCGKKSTQSQKAPNGTAVGQWPYKITVYECDGNVKGDELCVRDPIVWIKR